MPPRSLFTPPLSRNGKKNAKQLSVDVSAPPGIGFSLVNVSGVIPVSGVSNREFLEQYAQPGRVGLVGGVTLIEKAIRRAERHLDEQKQWSLWSHALVFEGERADGHHWVIESDLDIHSKHIRLGVQENRVDKYFEAKSYPTLAVLDFGLTEAQTAAVLCAGLAMVARHARYSLRELIGAAVALHNPWFRGRQNLLARRKSMYCSAFVQFVFQQAGIDLVPGIHPSHGTPEDISRTPLPHTTWLLQREPQPPLPVGLGLGMPCP
jgi:hypothetical protein